MKVSIFKYNAGNVRSVIFALQRIGIDPVWTDDPDILLSSDRVLFPGVGEARSAMTYLRERGLDAVFRDLRCPVLGICLGMQLMCRYSEENDTKCLGVFEETVERFNTNLKVPHMGWNGLLSVRGPLFRGIAEDDHVYFVHGYRVGLSSHTIAQSDYDAPFSAALHQNNFWGVQFHPEKSGEVGARILRNFLELESDV